MTKCEIEQATNEASLMQRVNHNHVMSIIDVFECEKYIILVLPLMRDSLRGYIETRPNALSEDEARTIFKMIINGMDACHQQNIMHCDLKLENIMVNFNDQWEIIDLCLADFGLALDI